jgi:hypothetical protein
LLSLSHRRERRERLLLVGGERGPLRARSFGRGNAAPASAHSRTRSSARISCRKPSSASFEAAVEVGVDRQVVGQQLRVEFFDVGRALFLLPAVDREQAGTSSSVGSSTRSEKPPVAAEADADRAVAPCRAQRAPVPRGLRAQRALARRAQRSAMRRAARASRRAPSFSAWRILLANLISFMSLSGRLKRYARLRSARQSMCRPGAMRLHAALRASHGFAVSATSSSSQ